MLGGTMPHLDEEEVRKRVNQLLRLADEGVKQKKYDEALETARRVFTIDLKNMYARAYEERILALKIEEERERLSRDAESRAEIKMEEELKRRMKEFHKTMEIEVLKKKEIQLQERSLEDHARKASVEEQQQIHQKDLATLEMNTRKSIEDLELRIASQLSRVTGRTAGNAHDSGATVDQVRSEYEAKLENLKRQYEEAEAARRKIHEEAFLKMSEEHQRAHDDLVKRMEEEREIFQQREREKSRQISLDAYQSVLASTEEIGLQPNLQAPLLQALRIPLSITEKEHNDLKREVHLASYMSALRGALQKGAPSEEDAENLKNLQILYGLTDEEHRTLTRAAKKDLGLPDETAVILVVDDDPVVQDFICHILKQTYRTVLSAANVDEAIEAASHNRPALILCDHHLGPGSISGIAFYEKILQNKYGNSLKDAHFVLMSAVRDEFFLKSARSLGIKTILPKPFTKESLESTLRDALH
jgi:CheY-like chemotaxis protein